MTCNGESLVGILLDDRGQVATITKAELEGSVACVLGVCLQETKVLVFGVFGDDGLQAVLALLVATSLAQVLGDRVGQADSDGTDGGGDDKAAFDLLGRLVNYDRSSPSA